MRRFAGSVLLLLVLVVLAAPAYGQGKDPFRPVSGAGGVTQGSAPGGGSAGGGSQGGGVEPPTGGGLPRTGLDLELPIVAAAALIAVGGSLRPAARAFAL